MTKFTLYLDKYLSSSICGKKVLVCITEDRGKFINRRCNFDENFINYDKVEIIVPEYIYTLGVGFFCGLIGYIFSQVGEQVVRKKIKLVNQGKYEANKNFEEAIRILKH